MNGPFVYDLPAVVLCDFCWVMDALSDLDWTRFGESEQEKITATVTHGKVTCPLAARCMLTCVRGIQHIHELPSIY